ncbi:MAG: hypothetical protein RI947_541 [Candidatus Parcubacteria bacterium]|jgi:ADP-ribose pyrophosphatase YjhB (NUDIX family)
MEKIDILDENMNVLYACDKSEAHEKGLLHATVIAEVHTSKGEWMLVKQADNKQDPGQYVSPVGGHVGSGESIEDALRRETEEEIGLKNFTYKQVGKAIFNRQVRNHQEHHYFVVYELYTDEKPVLNDESVAYEYFSTEELKKQYKESPKKFGDAFHFVVETFYKDLLT